MVASLIVLAAAAAAAAAPAAPAPTGVPDAPPRTAVCELAKATKVDFRREQTAAEMAFEGRYPIAFSLPAIAGGSAAEGSYYQVIDDPEMLFGPSGIVMDRVADRWPERVEIGHTASDHFVFAVLSEIDVKAGTANIFVSRGRDAFALDPNYVFRGRCRVTSGPSAPGVSQ